MPANRPCPTRRAVTPPGSSQPVGAQVTRCQAGDRVYTAGTASGAYAQLAVCQAEQVYPLPENLSFAQGAGLHMPYATAYRALF